VEFKDRKKGNVTSQVSLMELVDNAKFENSYPHTVGFFREPIIDDANYCSAYLEIRIVRSIEEFWKFLNDLNI
jgi:hypothetical protein